MQGNILIVEDDESLRCTLADVLRKKGHKISTAPSGEDALLYLESNLVDLVLLDQRLPGMDGLAVLRHIKELEDEPLVIIITAHPDVENAVTAMKDGAYDYINKPFELGVLHLLVDRALQTQGIKKEVSRLRHLKSLEHPLEEIVGVGPAIEGVRQLINKIAGAPNSPVLITGESGTGKELVANAIHYSSQRSQQPLVKINCGGIPSSLLEMELFGYEKGAFTDAKTSKKGLLEVADGGTLFLDEIGSMSLELQPKLLRVLEEKSLRRIGGLRNIPVDVRFIAASNEDLKSLISQGRLREDLFYRLNVMVVEIPPLRERVEDIMLLACLFLERAKKEMNKEIGGLSEGAEKMLTGYSWPGNVRELKNSIERAVILCESSTIRGRHLSLSEPKPGLQVTKEAITVPSPADIITLKELEQRYLDSVLKLLGDNKSEAARRLGISRTTLKEKLKPSS